MLLVQDGDIRGSWLLFVMEQEAAGTGQTRMDFAFSLCLEHACSFGNSLGAFSFGAWNGNKGRDRRSSPRHRREVSTLIPGSGMDIPRLCPAPPGPSQFPTAPGAVCRLHHELCIASSHGANPGQPHQLRSRLQFCL